MVATNLTSLLASPEFINTLIGTFAGAFAAFMLTLAREVITERNQRYGEIVRAQSVLGMQLNDVENLRSQVLNLYRDQPNRDHVVPKIGYPFTALRLNVNGLSFLTFEAERANSFAEILLAEETFRNCLLSIERFNEAKAAVREVGTFVGSDPKNIQVGFYLINSRHIDRIHELKIQTDSLYQTADAAAEKLERAIRELASVGKKILPERENGFLQFKWKTKTGVAPVKKHPAEVVV